MPFVAREDDRLRVSVVTSIILSRTRHETATVDVIGVLCVGREGSRDKWANWK